MKARMFYHTQVSDELLGRIHVLQELLEKPVGEPLLHGGRVLLQVFQTSANKQALGQRSGSTAASTSALIEFGQPCDAVAVNLQEAEEILGLLSISSLLFRR